VVVLVRRGETEHRGDGLAVLAVRHPMLGELIRGVRVDLIRRVMIYIYNYIIIIINNNYYY
jgi:hypothetical protein